MWHLDSERDGEKYKIRKKREKKLEANDCYEQE